jgi:chromosome segregation ATPase
MGLQIGIGHGIDISGERSQRSITREMTLRGELTKILARISRTNESIAGFEREKSRIGRALALMEPVFFGEEKLDEQIQGIEAARARLLIYEGERAKTEQAIAELSATPARTKIRQAMQEEFIQLAEKRIKKTRQVQGLVEQLRQALEERLELTEKLKNLAKGLECDLSGDCLDEARFEDTLTSLPKDILSSSEAWHSSLRTSNGRKA